MRAASRSTEHGCGTEKGTTTLDNDENDASDNRREPGFLIWHRRRSDLVLSSSFAGLTPGMVSLFVVNVQLTDDVPTGPSIPLYLNVTLSDGTVVSTNTVRIAVVSADSQ